MTEIEKFNFDGSEVRTVVRDGDPWFVAADVARVLGFANPSDAVTKHVDEEDVARATLAIHEGSRMVSRERPLVNESGVYALIFGSTKPEAKQFKRWVTHEVLPAIRKTGGYLSPTVDFSDPNTLRRVFDNWAADREKLEAANKELEAAQPKVELHDEIMEANGRMSVGELSGLFFTVNGERGRNKMYRLLVDMAMLTQDKSGYRPMSWCKDKWELKLGKPYQDKYGRKHVKTRVFLPVENLPWLRAKVTAHGGPEV